MELDLKQMIAMVDIIAEEKNLPKETVIDVIQQAIAAAWRRENGEKDMNVRCELDLNTGEADVYVQREVVEDGIAYIPETEIPQSEAKGKELGDIVEEKHKVGAFGRVASQTAKQVVLQRLRDAERDAVLLMFEDKIGTVVNGTIVRVEPKLVRVDLGKATGIMPRSEQIEGEYYAVGSRIKVYIKNIDRGERSSALILSRGCKEFIEHLFRQEVPEIEAGSVEIKAIAREAGNRTKMAVFSNDENIDAIGSCIGTRGDRVNEIVDELGNEKIDIIEYSEDPVEYIAAALSPAKVIKVDILDESGKKCKVTVPDGQLSLAIGNGGQNVRLAAHLTGWKIDIRPESGFYGEEEEESAEETE